MSSSETELMGALAAEGYFGKRLIQLINSYNSGDPRAQKTAMRLGEKYREYLPLGGTARDHADDIINIASQHIDSINGNNQQGHPYQSGESASSSGNTWMTSALLALGGAVLTTLATKFLNTDKTNKNE